VCPLPYSGPILEEKFILNESIPACNVSYLCKSTENSKTIVFFLSIDLLREGHAFPGQTLPVYKSMTFLKSEHLTQNFLFAVFRFFHENLKKNPCCTHLLVPKSTHPTD
jgi:hypothetical protein